MTDTPSEVAMLEKRVERLEGSLRFLCELLIDANPHIGKYLADIAIALSEEPKHD